MFGKQELVEALQSMVHEHGKKSSKKEEGKKAVTNEWLQQALPKLQDPTLRVLLSLAPNAQPAASSAPGAGGRSAGFGGGAAESSHTASGAAPLAGGGSGAGGSALGGGAGDDTETDDDDDAKSSGGEGQGAVQPGEECREEGEAKGAAAAARAPAAGGAVALSASEDEAFRSQHLADVLCAALDTLSAMRDLVNRAHGKSQAFKTLHTLQRDGSADSLEQIAAKLAECRPEGVASAAQLLSWLAVSVSHAV